MSDVSAQVVNAELYSVIVSGKISEGFELSQVKANVGTLFKLDERGVQKLFSGKPVAIRRGIEKIDALKLSAALTRKGLITVIRVVRPVANEVASNTAFSEKGIKAKAKPVDSFTPDINCPRCGHEQPFVNSCSLCKMELTLHIQRLKRKQQIKHFRQQAS
jgi:hypothetical protein